MTRDIETIIYDLLRKKNNQMDPPNILPELRRETKLADLSMDSLKLVEIIFELETLLEVSADEELMAELECLGDVIAMFEKALEEQNQIA